jgi:hypothetical protein
VHKDGECDTDNGLAIADADFWWICTGFVHSHWLGIEPFSRVVENGHD